MGFQIGNEFIGNIPEAVSQLIKEVERIKKAIALDQNPSLVKTYAEETVLSDEIFASFKTGDILTVEGNSLYTILAEKGEDFIAGAKISGVSASSVEITVIYWALGEAMAISTYTITGV